MKRALGLVVLLATFAACGGDKHPSRYPAREAGCDVQIFHEAPEMRTHNIGPVSASCDDRLSEADCLRTFKDEVCKLGGDIAWGVDNPVKDGGRIKFDGRAAHTKSPKSTDAGAPPGSL